MSVREMPYESMLLVVGMNANHDQVGAIVLQVGAQYMNKHGDAGDTGVHERETLTAAG